MQAGGTLYGVEAASTAEQMQTAMHSTRAASLKAAQVLADSYIAMVHGLLLGMSDALQSGGSAAAAKEAHQ